MQRSARPTGTAFITVDATGENEIVVSRGANADLDLSHVDLDPFDVVLAQMEVPGRRGGRIGAAHLVTRA